MKKIIFIISFLFFASYSIACSCKSKPKMEKAVERFDVVFTGKIISRKILNEKDSLYKHLTFTTAEYKILLTEKLKGEIKTFCDPALIEHSL